MTSDGFTAGDWIERLALALRSLAEVQESYLPEYYGRSLRMLIVFGEEDSHPPAFPLDELRLLYANAYYSKVGGKEDYYAPLCAVLDPVRIILRSHPTLAQVASPIIGRDEFWMVILNNGISTSPANLIAGLMARADELSGDRFRTAASELNAFLAPAGGGRSASVLGGLDVGYDAVLFYGLAFKERIDIGDGMEILPFDQVRAFVDENLVQELVPTSAGFNGWRSVGAVVKPFRWRPMFCRTGYERDLAVKSPEPFFVQARTFLELLAVAHGTAVLPIAMLNHCIDLSAARLLSREENRSSFYPGRSARGFDGFEECPELAQVALGEAMEVFEIRMGERYARMAPIVGRLAEALRRDGRFAVEDRILDVAIALERMYQLEGGEISHKMRTRVAWFLGADLESRLREMKAVKEFYEARSAIVHNSKRNAVTQRQRNAFAKGFDIARRSLFKFLFQEPPDDWNALVVGGS